MKLYVCGATRQTESIASALRSFCEKRFSGLYHLEIIDVLEDPERAAVDSIIATPTLLKFHPLPARRLIGTLTDGAHLAHALNLSD